MKNVKRGGLNTHILKSLYSTIRTVAHCQVECIADRGEVAVCWDVAACWYSSSFGSNQEVPGSQGQEEEQEGSNVRRLGGGSDDNNWGRP